MNNSQKPAVALTLGDPAGIGPELIAKLIARRDVVERAKVVLVGDAVAVGRRPGDCRSERCHAYHPRFRSGALAARRFSAISSGGECPPG